MKFSLSYLFFLTTSVAIYGAIFRFTYDGKLALFFFVLLVAVGSFLSVEWNNLLTAMRETKRGNPAAYSLRLKMAVRFIVLYVAIRYGAIAGGFLSSRFFMRIDNHLIEVAEIHLIEVAGIFGGFVVGAFAPLIVYGVINERRRKREETVSGKTLG